VTVYLVGAGPGDPGLLTRRGAELLARAEVVVFDRLVSPALLALAPATARLVDVGKSPGDDSARRQARINALLVEEGLAGRHVVRLKGGDPFVFGRGGEEATALRDAGVGFEVVPGVTSAFGAPAYAGVPVTHRGLATSVTVVTGNVVDPHAGGVDWAALARAGGTIVVLMGMEHRAEIAARLVDAGRAPDTPVVVVHRGSMPQQAVVRTTLAGLREVTLGAPATVVIGAVAGLDLGWWAPGPLAGDTVVVTRGRDQAGRLGAVLRHAGAEVVELALIEIAAPPDGGAALAAAADRVRAGAYDWVVCTSANGVERFVSTLRDGRDLGATKLAAVGPATAASLGAHRLVADLVPDDASAEGLAVAFPTGPGRVLYPRAVRARPVLAAGLRAKAWEVDEVDAYDTVPRSGAPDLAAGVLQVGAGAVVTFTSPSTVEAYRALPGAPEPGVVACIGPVTAQAARRAGFRVDVEALDRSADGLVEALVAHRRGRAPT
jgi:uroporphyrinogen III methyltransferase/synthase